MRRYFVVALWQNIPHVKVSPNAWTNDLVANCDPRNTFSI
jgi:hypothetical protein